MKRIDNLVRFVSTCIIFLFLIGAVSQPKKYIDHKIIDDAFPRQAEQTSSIAKYKQLPMVFEVNQGQTDLQTRFFSRGAGYYLYLTQTEAVLALNRPPQANLSSTILNRSTNTPAVLRMHLAGANQLPQLIGMDLMPTEVNYFKGSDPEKWQTGIPIYKKIKYESVYPGVDLIYYGSQEQLEYDFLVAPGAHPSRISFYLEGADQIELDATGELIAHFQDGQVHLQRPLIYQEFDGEQKLVPGGYKLIGPDHVAFQVGDYDKSRLLVIDPILEYSTYLGGSANELGFGIAADNQGNAYITGLTFSTDFPAVNPIQGALLGTNDVFVTKLDPNGSPIYSTYFGGLGAEDGGDIAVDQFGNAYVTGRTGSADFPTVAALQSIYMGGGNDGFVTKLDSTGSIVYSTYLGGWYGDVSTSLAVDEIGNVYVTGLTYSPNFPTVNPLQAAVNGSGDLFVSKLNPAGSTLLYSTYIGGTGYEDGRSIAVNASGNVYVTGLTTSTDFPLLSPFQAHIAGTNGVDAFVLKLSSGGSSLEYSTYLGGTYDDWGQGIGLDSLGNAFITGTTFSNDFPTTGTAFQPIKASPGANSDAFVTKIAANGSALLYSTYLGGLYSNGDDGAADVAVDSSGNAYILGATRSASFPILNAVQPVIGGYKDAFITKLNPMGTGLIYSTFLGGAGEDNDGGMLGEGPFGPHIAVDASGNVYATGNTASNNFPTVNPFQPSFGGLFDAFVVKLVDNHPPSVDAGGPYSVIEGRSITVTAIGSDLEDGIPTFMWDLDNNGSFETPGQSVTFSAAELNAPNSYIISVQAVDRGNLSTTDQVVVTVIYNFTGFFQPVDNLPVMNLIPAGRAIPVKFSLAGDKGMEIFATGYPGSTQVVCGNTAEDAIEETVNAGSSTLSYSPGIDQYIYTWKTEKSWAGTCRTLVMKLRDETYHRVNFKFR
jgi:hypothetical protein